MISVDSSVVVRYLVGTPSAQADRARALMDDSEQVGIPTVVLLESAHVLRTQYGVERRDVLDTTIELLTRDNMHVLGATTNSVVEALVRARGLPGAPLPDALVAAIVRDTGAMPLYTFVRESFRHGIPVREP